MRPIVNGYFTIRDGKGAESTTLLHVPSNTEIGNFKIFIQNTAGFIDAIIKGKVVGLGLAIGVALPGGLKSAADALSDVEEIGRFVFSTADGGKPRMNIPTIDEAKVLTGTANIDLADTDVDAFVTQMVDGQTISAQAQHPSDIDGHDIESLESAIAAFGKSRT